jgi:hypothetical protein
VKAAVRSPAAMPKLEKDGSTFGMDSIYHLLPGLSLFIGIDAWTV